MRFELRSTDRGCLEISSSREEAIEFPSPVGHQVCYRQPLVTDPLNSLPSAIANSGVLQQLKGRTYCLESNYGYIRESIPAVEYYKFGLNRIRDNLHAIEICEGRIRDLIGRISRHFHENKELSPLKQYWISFDLEAYELRTEISNLVFLVRAVLDIFSTIFQTIYGPSVGQFSSFSQVLKAVRKENSKFPDAALSEYLNRNIEWYYLLKDVRDYLAHYGTFKFSFREEGPHLGIYVFWGKEVGVLVASLHQGLYALLEFINGHWASYVESHNK